MQPANSNEDHAFAMTDLIASQYQRRALAVLAILIPLVAACSFAAGWIARGMPY